MLCDSSTARESGLAKPLACCLEPARCFYTYFHSWSVGLAHKDLNQQKMGIPPEHDIDNSVPRQSQEGRDLLKKKTKRRKIVAFG